MTCHDSLLAIERILPFAYVHVCKARTLVIKARRIASEWVTDLAAIQVRQADVRVITQAANMPTHCQCSNVQNS